MHENSVLQAEREKLLEEARNVLETKQLEFKKQIAASFNKKASLMKIIPLSHEYFGSYYNIIY